MKYSIVEVVTVKTGYSIASDLESDLTSFSSHWKETLSIPIPLTISTLTNLDKENKTLPLVIFLRCSWYFTLTGTSQVQGSIPRRPNSYFYPPKMSAKYRILVSPAFPSLRFWFLNNGRILEPIKKLARRTCVLETDRPVPLPRSLFLRLLIFY